MPNLTISDIKDFIDFSQGKTVDGHTSNEGTAEDRLVVTISTELDFDSIEDGDDYEEYKYNWPGILSASYMDIKGRGNAIKNISYQNTTHWGFIRSGNNCTISNLDILDMNVTISGSFQGSGYRTCTEIFGCKITGNIQAGEVVSAIGGHQTLVRECCFIGNIVTGGQIQVMGYDADKINSWADVNITSSATGDGARIALIGDGNALNCYTIATYNKTQNGKYSKNLIACGTANFCYVVITNIAAIKADGFRSNQQIFGNNSNGAMYESVAATTEDDSRIAGQAWPWSTASGEIWQEQGTESEAGAFHPVYAELNLKSDVPFKARGYPIK